MWLRTYAGDKHTRNKVKAPAEDLTGTASTSASHVLGKAKQVRKKDRVTDRVERSIVSSLLMIIACSRYICKTISLKFHVLQGSNFPHPGVSWFLNGLGCSAQNVCWFLLMLYYKS